MADEAKPQEEKKRRLSRQEVAAEALKHCDPFNPELRLDFFARGAHIAAMVSDLAALQLMRDYTNTMGLRLAFWADAFSKLLVPNIETKGKTKEEVIAALEPGDVLKAVSAIQTMRPAISALNEVTQIRERTNKELTDKMPPTNDDDGLYQVPVNNNAEREKLWLQHVQQTGKEALPAPALSTQENPNHVQKPEEKRTSQSPKNRSTSRRSNKSN